MKNITVTVSGLVLGSFLLTGSVLAQHTAAERNAAPAAVVFDGNFVPFEQACSVAKAENKLILIDFYTDWCGWCKRMDRDTYHDPNVQAALTKYFACTKLNAEAKTEHDVDGEHLSERAIAQKFKVTGYPTITFLTPDQKILRVVPGYVGPAEFVDVLNYMGSGAYSTQSFNDWKAKSGGVVKQGGNAAN